MDAMIKQTMQGYLTAFDSANVTDESLKAEIEQYKSDLNSIAESSGDVSQFMEKLTSEGINEKQSELIAKAYSPQPDSSSGKTAATPNLPTVKEFLNNYKPSYEAAKAHGYQDNAVKEYEELFKVAERTDDLLEMNLIFEKERLLWKPTVAAFYDINKLTYDSQNVYNDATRLQFKKLMELGENCKSQEELDYLNDLKISENQQNSYRFNWERIAYPATLSKYIMDYLTLKLNIWADNNLPESVSAFYFLRNGIKEFYPKAKEITGLDYDDLVNHPFSKIYLLAAANVDELGLSFEALDDEVIDFWRCQLEEILSDKTEEEILTTVPEMPMIWGMDKRLPEQEAAFKKMVARSKEVLSKRYFYGYHEKVGVPDMSSYS